MTELKIDDIRFFNECINFMKPDCNVGIYAIHRNTCKNAIEALEKQIPKKPILKIGESVMAIDYADGHGEMKKSRWQDWVCPVCGWFVGKRFNADQRKPHDQRKSCYCNECGQKIDWGEEK